MNATGEVGRSAVRDGGTNSLDCDQFSIIGGSGAKPSRFEDLAGVIQGGGSVAASSLENDQRRGLLRTKLTLL